MILNNIDTIDWSLGFKMLFTEYVQIYAYSLMEWFINGFYEEK